MRRPELDILTVLAGLLGASRWMDASAENCHQPLTLSRLMSRRIQCVPASTHWGGGAPLQGTLMVGR